jgi:hypothetical protein
MVAKVGGDSGRQTTERRRRYLCTTRNPDAAGFDTCLTPVTAAKIRTTPSTPAIADKIKRGSIYTTQFTHPMLHYSNRINLRFKYLASCSDMGLAIHEGAVPVYVSGPEHPIRASAFLDRSRDRF